MMEDASILAVTAVLGWWLSGYDSAVTGEHKAADIRRRAIRCSATLILVGMTTGAMSVGGRFGGFVFLALVLPVGILWTGCVSEMFARVFHGLIDSQDSGKVDSEELTRELDTLAKMIQQGRSQEAIELAGKLKKSGAGSVLALEAALFRIYDEMFTGSAFASTQLAETEKAYDEGHYLLAEFRLKELLKEQPRNLRACLILLKLYAQNLHSPKRALAALHEFELRRVPPPGFVEYARHHISEWADPDSERKKSSEGIESILVEQKEPKPSTDDPPAAPAATAPSQELIPPEELIDPDLASVEELLVAGHLGTAIEKLERHLKLRPNDFDLRLQLAEAHGLHCCNLNRATQIVEKIERDKSFSTEQIRRAKEKLMEWQARKPNSVAQ